jgi:hypothetical protein
MFSSDGMKINTTGDWAQMCLSVVDKRESAERVGPQKWADRVLPEPTARVGGACALPADRGTLSGDVLISVHK